MLFSINTKFYFINKIANKWMMLPLYLVSEFVWCWDSQQEGMVELIGMLKVKVIRGVDLAVRDMLTSDPYVILTLGKQVGNSSHRHMLLGPAWKIVSLYALLTIEVTLRW